MAIDHRFPDADELMARAWPDRVPPEEIAYLRSLPRDKAEQALARLAALLGSEEGGANAAALASRADFAVSTLYRLRERWAAVRSLRSLGIQRISAPRPRSDERVAEARREAEDLVRSAPGFVSDAELARQLRRRTRSVVTDKTALSLVRRARRAAALDGDALSMQYGQDLLVDACALDIPPAAGGDPVCAAVVIETASRLVLAATVGLSFDLARQQGRALERAIGFLARGRLDRLPSGGPGEIEILLPPTRSGAFLSSRLAELPDVRVEQGTARRIGARLNALLDGRLGDLVLAPRRTLSLQVEAGETETRLDDAALLLETAVAEHNVPIVQVLRTVSETRPMLVGEGCISARIRQVCSAYASWTERMLRD